MTTVIRNPAGALLWILLCGSPAGATESEDFVQRCLAERVVEAADDTSVGTLRRACERDLDANGESMVASGTGEESPVAARLKVEKRQIDQPFSLLAHRPTYLLPYSYNRKVNDNQPAETLAAGNPRRTEAGFQISFKLPLWRDVLGSGDNIFLGYTNRSFWQLYDPEASSPFRSSDHEPELFWRHYREASLGPVNLYGFDLGFSHQSNGRSLPLSRSWNRIVGSTVLSAGNVALGIRSWARIPEKSSIDDNPDIEDFLGYGDLRLIYTPNRNSFTLMMRPAKKGGGVEFTWSRRLSTVVRLYAQYYHGFGETLIDYDHRVDRFSLGIALNDYLVNDDRALRVNSGKAVE